MKKGSITFRSYYLSAILLGFHINSVKDNTLSGGCLFYMRRQNWCCALRVMSPTSVACWASAALRCRGQTQQSRWVCSGRCATQPHRRQGAHRAPQTGLQNRCRITSGQAPVESCRPDQHCEPKKISVRKTPKPQRFLGFFVPFFKVEFKRYHFPKTTFGEDLNFLPKQY